MFLYVGIDDTDTLEKPGTGRVARALADRLGPVCSIHGITRHQLYIHPSIPYTSHNSCAVLHLHTLNGTSRTEILNRSRKFLDEMFVEGRDPGLALAGETDIGPGLIRFGVEAKHTVLTQRDARNLARNGGIILEGLGGTEDGVIGALAGIGLAASANDGRYIQKGRLRDLKASARVEELLVSGVDLVTTLEGRMLTKGMVHFKKFPKPARIQNRSVLFVRPHDDAYEEVVIG